MDLRLSLIPEELIEHLTQTMPKHQGPVKSQDRDVPQYDYISFMGKMMADEDSDDASTNGQGQ
jgi:hypothetical protein